jgi:hypothetical protein
LLLLLPCLQVLLLLFLQQRWGLLPVSPAWGGRHRLGCWKAGWPEGLTHGVLQA